jgi:hypothetical protein
MRKLKYAILTLGMTVLIGCGGGGGSSCPGNAPLECTSGKCCPRGYPYSCGNGLCYEYGCPVGSPEIGICELKLNVDDAAKSMSEVPVVSKSEAGQCVPQSEPEENTDEDVATDK